MGLAVWFRARNVVFFGFLVAAMVAVSLLVVARPAHAVSTFTVNTTLDTGDATPDGVCDSNPHPFVISCSVREAIQAIQEANAAANSGGPDLIKFSIFGPGPHTI